MFSIASFYSSNIEICFYSSPIFESVSSSVLQGKLGVNERKLIGSLIEHKIFSGMLGDFSINETQWINYLLDTKSEQVIPMDFIEKDSSLSNEKDIKLREDILKSSILSVTKPDRMMITVKSFINTLFGDEFLQIPEVDVKNIVEK